MVFDVHVKANSDTVNATICTKGFSHHKRERREGAAFRNLQIRLLCWSNLGGRSPGRNRGLLDQPGQPARHIWQERDVRTAVFCLADVETDRFEGGENARLAY